MALFSHKPRPPLSAFVTSIWLAEGYVPGPHRQERILPTGDCSLIVDLGGAGGVGLSGPQSQSFVIETSAQFSVAVAYAIGAFERDPALVRIADVTSRIGLSHRRFLDLFAGEVGLTPKLFCRIRRFQRVVCQIRAGAEVKWAELALSCGYYDQAHFIKDFTAFSGVNPSTYRASRGPHPNHVPLQS